MAPRVDSEVAPSGDSKFRRRELNASVWYLKSSLSQLLVVNADVYVNITAFKRAWSSSPFRRTDWKFWSTSSSETLRMGSVACMLLSGLGLLANAGFRLLR